MRALAAAAVCACAAARPAASPASPPAGASGWSRHVAPFEVRDSSGRPYAQPFLGGFNAPRPQLVDIDGDGDDDLFVQETTGRIMFLEHTAGVFLWRTDHYQSLEVGEWFRFVDLDGDGDYDLLAEEPYSHVRAYRNEGTRTQPAFHLVVDTLRDAGGTPIFSDRQNIPNLLDVDCDGALDLFLGQLTGTVARYESVGLDPDGLPRFQLLTNRFEDIEIVATIGSLHGANTLVFHDIEGDGDPDLFWGDFFEPGVLLIENRGSCAAPSLRGDPRPFPPGDPLATSGYNAPAFGDVDGDGDADLLVGVLGGAYNPNRTAIDNLYFYQRGADGAFIRRSGRFVPTVDVGAESAPALADLDGDGDFDLVVGNKIDPADAATARLTLLENTGTRSAPRFRIAGPLDFTGHYYFAPAFGDLDADGDADLILGTWRDALLFYRNEGGAPPQWVLVDSAVVRLTRGSNATPALGDVDGDGDLDLMVGEGAGTINFYRNTGTAARPQFALESDEFLGIDVGRRARPALVDLDGDGDLDLVIGSEAGGLAVYRNTGTRTTPAFVADGVLPVDAPTLASPSFGDLDGDGSAELVLGGLGGGLWYFTRRP